MDEASKLVSELQNKLSELDHKVWQYRRDMASEFTKYAEDVLRGVGTDISETVSKTIAESMKAYKSLHPDEVSTVESCPDTGSLPIRVKYGTTSSYSVNTTTIIPYQREEAESDLPRSPHAREKEFQGVFTPSYLPLLDSTNRNERRSSYDPQVSPLKLDNRGKEKEMAPSHVDSSIDTRSLAPAPELRKPPTPKRKNTDELSIASDISDGPVRRSALRRSSSSSKGLSPRRVRFDVEGEEVLPTVAPLPIESLLGFDFHPGSGGLGDNSDEDVGLQRVEDIDSPPPKRISSSQALRALSRSPLEDDGTQWTTVSQPPDSSDSVAAVGGVSQDDSSEDLSVNGQSHLNSDKSAQQLGLPEVGGGPIQSAPTVTPSHKSSANTSKVTETPSDDERFDLPQFNQTRSHRPTTTILSPIHEPSVENNKSHPTATRSPSKPWFGLESYESKQDGPGEDDFKFLEEDQEDLFHFDENNEHQGQLEEEHEDTDLESPISPVAETEPLGIGQFSRSPVQDIPKQTAPRPSTTPSKGVVGSYRGRPFSMPIVSDEIHARAAQMGAMNSFVGSVNGRSGLDASDVQSFRASGGIGSFSGTPKTLSERMMMDELLEAEEVIPNDTRAFGGRE